MDTINTIGLSIGAVAFTAYLYLSAYEAGRKSTVTARRPRNHDVQAVLAAHNSEVESKPRARRRSK